MTGWYWHSAGRYWSYDGKRATPPSGSVVIAGKTYDYNAATHTFTEIVVPPSGSASWKQPPPPAQVPIAHVIGAYTSGSLTGFTSAEKTIGNLGTTRLFYSGELPASFSGRTEAQLPAGVLPVVSYKTPTTNVVSYVKSVTRPLVLIFHHEPENDFSTGSDFVQAFSAQSKLIRSAGNSHVQVATAALGYRYKTGGNGVGGAYIPAASDVDIYAIDIYQHQSWAWPSQGLANYDQWLNWLSCVKNSGRPLAITEYGIDNTGGGDSARNARLKEDAAYLRQTFHGNLAWFSYWYANTSYNYQFTDAVTISTWKSIVAGTL